MNIKVVQILYLERITFSCFHVIKYFAHIELNSILFFDI